MKFKENTPWFLITMTCALLVSAGTARAQRLYLVVDRTAGTVGAVSSGELTVDGYSITSESGLLNPEAWSSLSDQGDGNWTEANPASDRLTELNLSSAGTLPAGQPVGLGAPYVGGVPLPRDEDVGFQFTTPDGTIHDGIVLYTGPSPVPTVTVNRESGNVTLTNTGGFDIDGYSIASASGLLDPAGLAGLADFTAANPSETLVSELNLGGSVAFPATLNLGNIYNGAAGAGIDQEDLTLQYSTPEGVVADGVVSYVGAVNDLTLQVDRLTGQASIQNLSPNIDPFEVTGYSVLSPSGGLTAEALSSVGEGFEAANPTATAIAELSASGSRVFDTGTSVSLGNIFTGGEEDLVFEFTTLDGVHRGSVQYVLNLGGQTPGDCNGDGVVNAADLACVTTIPDRDVVLGVLNTLPGDLNGNGDVAFADFLVMSANFGQPLGTYPEGDIDLNGEVAFADFLILSANFGQVPAAAAAVPEPGSATLAALAVLICFAFRKRR